MIAAIVTLLSIPLIMILSEAAYIIEPTWQLRPWWGTLSVLDRRMYQMLAGGLLLSLGLDAWGFLSPASSNFVTEFYAVEKDGFIENYPYQVSLTDPVTVSVGVVNHEQKESKYHVEVWITDRLNSENRIRVAQSQVFLLQPGEKRTAGFMAHAPDWQ